MDYGELIQFIITIPFVILFITLGLFSQNIITLDLGAKIILICLISQTILILLYQEFKKVYNNEN